PQVPTVGRRWIVESESRDTATWYRRRLRLSFGPLDQGRGDRLDDRRARLRDDLLSSGHSVPSLSCARRRCALLRRSARASRTNGGHRSRLRLLGTHRVLSPAWTLPPVVPRRLEGRAGRRGRAVDEAGLAVSDALPIRVRALGARRGVDVANRGAAGNRLEPLPALVAAADRQPGTRR